MTDSVIIGYITDGNTKAEFTRSLTNVTALGVKSGILRGQLMKISGPRIAMARNNLVEDFLARDADWLFMVDTDMTFDPDVLERFLATADPVKRPIVSGLCFGTGRDGIFPTVFKLFDDESFRRIDSWPRGEIFPVDATGAAALFVHRSVFEAFNEDDRTKDRVFKWFEEATFGGGSVGEDITFCIRARSLGFPIYIDSNIQFGHIKEHIIDVVAFDAWRERSKVVVTGTSRCGTAYVAALFQTLSVMMGHEWVYGPDGPNWGDVRADSSWMAAPYLEAFDGYVIHLVRDPVDTINSLVGTGFFDDALYDKHAAYRVFAEKWMPQVFDYEEPVERAMAWWINWNKMIEPHADVLWNVETVTPEQLTIALHKAGGKHAYFEAAATLQAVPKNVNHRPHADMTWDDLPAGKLKNALRKAARKYGYSYG